MSAPGWLDGVVLGLVQGLTEFLPVSSSGHLVLAQEILGFEPPGLWFEIGLHVATLLSVAIAFAPALGVLLTGLWRRQPAAWRYLGVLLLGSVPAAIVGLALRDLVEPLFDAGPALGASFLFTALVLWTGRRWAGRPGVAEVTPRAALTVGLAQAVAILPGVSRSGTTIVAGLGAGIAPARSAEYSFFLAVIAIAGSGLLEVRHLPPGADLLSPVFLTAFFVAMVSGVWAIRFLVRLLERGRFHRFAWYCLAVGLFTLAWSVLGR